MKSEKTASRLLVWLAGILAGTGVIVLPLGYFSLSYQRMAGSLESESEINARLISQIIGANPEMWRFEEPRIREYLSRRPSKHTPEIRRVVDTNGAPILTDGDVPRPPVMVRAADLFDAGRVVGRIEISRSLWPILVKTALALLFALLLGAATLYLIIVLPIRLVLHSEKALRESEHRYRMLFEEAGDSILVLELPPDGLPIIREANPAALRIHGYTRDELIGNPISILDANPAHLREPIAQARTAEGSVIEVRRRCKDGSVLTAETKVRTMQFGSARYAIFVERDITERKRTEEARANAQRLESLGTLAGGIAHDFNNILTAILGNLSLLQSHINGGEALELITEAQKACGTAGGLARQLLTFAKGGSPVVKILDLRDTLTQAASFAARGSNSRCVFDLGEKPLPALVDKDQISQVIQNLIINARQAMPGGGEITVRAAVVSLGKDDRPPLAAGRYIRVTVADQGCGIPAEQLSRIFEPYFSTKAVGRGLGLAISHSIMAKHGGHIAVESRPGAGAVFNLHFPAANTADILSESKLPALAPGRGKVLIMDDDETVAKVLKRILEQLGYRTEFVPDGKAALDAYRKEMRTGQPYDAVIMDLTIPGGMGGKEAIGKLREIDPGAKVIVSSGYSNDPVMSDWKGSDFSGALVKPYNLAQVSEALRKTLGSDLDQPPRRT